MRPAAPAPTRGRVRRDGYGGILRVQVMMEDGAISAVNILEQHETDGIGSRALDILLDEMIRMNTWDVDVSDRRDDDEQCPA